MSADSAFDMGDFVETGPAPSLDAPYTTGDFEAAPAGAPATATSPSAAATPSSPSLHESKGEISGEAKEPTALQLWQAERSKKLAAKRAKAAVDKEATLEQAREELAGFAAKRADKIAKNKEANRKAEIDFRNDMEALMAHGSRWEKVNKLVGSLTTKADTGKGAAQKRDRFRKLLLQLKSQKDPDEVKSAEKKE